MPNSNRGFAAMDPEEQRRIASKGGRAAHESGHAHEWNSGEAAEAGRRGGLASHGERAASLEVGLDHAQRRDVQGLFRMPQGSLSRRHLNPSQAISSRRVRAGHAPALPRLSR